MPIEPHANVSAGDGIERLAPARQYPILYVDDERDNLIVFKAVLSDEFNVLLAQSGTEALELIAREPIAVVVADQRMPHMSGIELCHFVSERAPAVRRILLTAYSDHQTAIRAINRGGVHGYLEKPWDPLTMRRTLWEAVNRAHMDRALAELRFALEATEERLERARDLERLLHDMSNAAMRVSLTQRVLRKILTTQGQELPNGVRSQLEREAGKLERAVEHLEQLQRDRAAFSSHGPHPEPLRLDEVLRTVVALAEFPPSERLRLVVDASPGLSAYADRVAVARVLVNLVKNARESVEEGSGGAGEVRISARPEADRVVLDVADSGTGVPPELRGRIFEEFFTTKRQTGGTGLGLAGARELAQATGGHLELPEPQPAKGALFRLTLPAVPPQPPAEAAGPAPP